MSLGFLCVDPAMTSVLDAGLCLAPWREQNILALRGQGPRPGTATAQRHEPLVCRSSLCRMRGAAAWG